MRDRLATRTWALAASGLALASLATAATSFTDTESRDETVILSKSDSPTPPGMVLIKKGRTLVGSDKKQIAELMEDETNHGALRILDGETPQHRAEVGEFLLGKYEVTNEQYLQFVKATNRQPPEHWGLQAVQGAMRAFQKAEAEKQLADSDYKRQQWSPEKGVAWWRDNWQEAEWSIPKGEEGMPVSYVSYEDAVAYCAWIGMRLPDEFEWVRAARAEKDQWFTWGDEWDATGNAHTSELRRQKLYPVGSFEKGASEFGICDMIGGVWEWTSSPYSAFDRFKPNKYQLATNGGKKKETVQREPKFNSAFRVTKGGSFQNGLLAARIPTRQGTMRSQTTNAIGFRLAASTVTGRDKAEALYEKEIRTSGARKNGEIFDLDAAAGIDRYTLADVEGDRPAGYAVVSAYDHIVFTPRAEFPFSPGGELDRESRMVPTVVGFLTTSVPMETPKLEPGTYFVSYRQAGRIVVNREEKAKDKDKDEGEEEEIKIDDDTPIELLNPEQRLLRRIEADLNKDIMIFSEVTTGEYVAHMPFKKITSDIKARKATPARVAHRVEEVWAGEGQDKYREKQDWLDIHANIRMSERRLIPLDIELQVVKDALGTGWRQ